MPQNSDWYKRRNAIDQELGGGSKDIADVRVVQWDAFRGSCERGPVARHFGTIGAGAANHHVGIALRAIDGSESSSRNVAIFVQHWVTSHAVTVFLAQRAGLTLTAENPITPVSMYPNDADVVPMLAEVDFLNTDIPTGVGAGISAFTSAYAGQNASIVSSALWFPGHLMFQNPNQESLFIISNSAATAFHYTVQWQAVRI